MKYIITTILFLIFSSLVIVFTYNEGGPESIQPVFISAILAVQLVFVVIGASYISKKDTQLTSLNFAVASFVPMSWIGAIIFPLNFIIRINGSNISSLVLLGLLSAFCVTILLLRKFKNK